MGPNELHCPESTSLTSSFARDLWTAVLSMYSVQYTVQCTRTETVLSYNEAVSVFTAVLYIFVYACVCAFLPCPALLGYIVKTFVRPFCTCSVVGDRFHNC